MNFDSSYVKRDEEWWRAQRVEVRGARGAARYDTQLAMQMYNDLVAHQMIPGELLDTYRKIVGWGWTPTAVYDNVNGLGSESLDALVISPDLVLHSNPLGWSNRPGDGGIRGAIGTTYGSAVADQSRVGATFTDASKSKDIKYYRKMFMVAEGGVDPTFYPDWSLKGMTEVWVRVPKELL